MPRPSTTHRGGYTDFGPNLQGGPVERMDDGADIAAGVIVHGMQFFVESIMTDHELIGMAICVKTLTFTAGDPDTTITCAVPATSAASFSVVVDGVVVMTIDFAAGATSGTNTTATIAKGKTATLYGPSPADPTLSFVTANINGTW